MARIRVMIRRFHAKFYEVASSGYKCQHHCKLYELCYASDEFEASFAFTKLCPGDLKYVSDLIVLDIKNG